MRFSVMIPTFRGRRTIATTLRSVCSQLDASDHQIVVWDDACPEGPYDDIVSAFPGVKLIRNRREWGGTKTHNGCIDLAFGDLVHLLHSDDLVCPGFYATIAHVATQSPTAALIATYSIVLDADGTPKDVPAPAWLTDDGKWAMPLHCGNPLRVPGCVVRRSAYREHGGWDKRLIHASDWECWVRMSVKGGAATVVWPLACHREHPANHTSRLQRTGDNLRDIIRMAGIVEEYAPHLVCHPDFEEFMVRVARAQAARAEMAGDVEAAVANTRLAGG